MFLHSEKPDEYSKPPESCQANEIFEDSLYRKGAKYPLNRDPREKIKEFLMISSSAGEPGAVFFGDRQNLVEQNFLRPFRILSHH